MTNHHAPDAVESVAGLAGRAREWFAARMPRRDDERAGQGKPWSVEIFFDGGIDDDRAQLREAQAWLQEKWCAGLAGIDWAEEFGGWGLTREHADAVAEVEAEFEVPHHELLPITTHLVAPMLRLLGTDEQRRRWVGGLARGEMLCAQLFSEPSAGSDLAGVTTRATPVEDGWSIAGQKVWSSGARLAQWGMLLARSDVDAVKHAGMTAFMLPLDTPGVDVRPLRQMTGGACFNEIFLDSVRIPDDLRVGAVGDGWKVATTMLGFERDASGDDITLGGSWMQVLALADAVNKRADPTVRPLLADAYARYVLARVAAARDLSDRQRGLPRGPEGSMRKLQWVYGLNQMSATVIEILGPRLVADTGEPETYGWNEHVLGALGYGIAGGSNEIQRGIIAERLLRLPAGPRVDRGVPFKDIPFG
jgi:alkylation response protein AidB-like acyl-CoA dehydrogenase